jgi:hypothetical protein
MDSKLHMEKKEINETPLKKLVFVCVLTIFSTGVMIASLDYIVPLIIQAYIF